jgi:hypothetical protein
MQADRISFSELDSRFTDYIRREDQTLWAQGDELVRFNPSDAEFEKLAEHHSRSVGTLRLRMKVANEFPAESRDVGAFSVYAHLVKIGDPAKRASILAEREPGGWTVDAMAQRVSQYLRDAGYTRRAADMRRAGMRLGDFKVSGQSDTPGNLLMITSNAGISSTTQVGAYVMGSTVVVQITV